MRNGEMTMMTPWLRLKRSGNSASYRVRSLIPRVVAETAAWLDGGPKENDAEEDDEDLRSDPIAQIDLGVSFSSSQSRADQQQHLTELLRRCYTTNENGMHEMVDELTDNEKGILRGVLTL